MHAQAVSHHPLKSAPTLWSCTTQEAWEGWRAWHGKRMAKADLLGAAMGRIDVGRLARMLGAWRDFITTRRLDLQVRLHLSPC
jgi:hypothetical protein